MADVNEFSNYVQDALDIWELE